MKRFLAVALACAFALTLAGCVVGGGTTPATATGDALAKVIQISVETGCSVTPSLIDIGTALAASAGGVAGALAAGPVDVIAKSFAANICAQWKAKQTVHALVSDDCLATVNGVCIRKSK